MRRRLPALLYKYIGEKTASKYLLDMLKEKYIFLSNPENVNDVFDCTCSFDEDTIMAFPINEDSWDSIFYFLSLENIDTEGIEINLNAKAIGDIFSYLRGKVDASTLQIVKTRIFNSLQTRKTSVLLYSMSEVNDSLLMWAHYGDHLKGVVLCLDPEKDMKLFTKAHKVVYSRKRYYEATIKAVRTKASVWKYEREWRILTHHEEKHCKTSAIVAVIMGYDVSVELANNLLGFCVQNGMPLFRAEPDNKLYKINIVTHYIPDPGMTYNKLIREITNHNH